MYILDTNILIYLLRGSMETGRFLGNLRQERFSISIVSRLEVLMGAQKENFTLNELENYLDLFENISLDKKIVKEALTLKIKTKDKLKFKDLIIAATAKLSKKILITSDNGLRRIPGIKVKFRQAETI